ncbi:isopentenyl-diphosphate Delta-isomerase [Arthrobacter bambusae]|uniref:Isopentenyl-diphosphate Delta-isomerase n=1 Tax=Arthrobacter bambusae TaxID=1338426 RepID=A0AAW8DK03_9MICC|nr:isopentenyl-diphosphate Delta-isomerase [Arthrobacter bambusae]MDP9906181.1 isopentenyl-diphosphate delta-isomerase [Arthrobacter bambusae]MDQ0130586.1 isopentenyl-diphosphate delta-isomerase [Arthrobacter bambusae]MDQ0182261.1 isopentenyl-diphosphate delta-isomerase [Arthrobacter bambusae]
MSWNDPVVLLNDANEPIGTCPKADAHQGDGIRHLAFSCYAFDANGRVLLTRRAWTKETFPGVMTNTCCGHPVPGETLVEAVKRRMRDELNLEVNDLQLALPDFEYVAQSNEYVEREFCPVFACRVDHDPVPNPVEVDEAWWEPWVDVVALAEVQLSPLSPWARLQVPLLSAMALPV